MDSAYFKFLDKRIPELQNEGKPHPPSTSDGMKTEERVQLIRENMKGSKYPGRAARDQADREWAAMQKKG